MRGDWWFEQDQKKEVREERQRVRGVLLYLEERYEQVDEKISGFDSFPEEIKGALDKYIDSLKAKYFWPGIEKDVRRVVESCEPCRLHMNSQARDPHRLSLEYVSRPMQAIGIDFFQRGGHKYLLMMDHFSGMPLYEKMGISTDNEHTVRQLKRWFATFGVSRSIRCDNGPPFSSMGFKEFCDKYGIQLKLTSPYNLESSGAAERGVGLVKNIMKKTEEDGSCMEEAMSVFRNTRNVQEY